MYVVGLVPKPALLHSQVRVHSFLEEGLVSLCSLDVAFECLKHQRMRRLAGSLSESLQT